ncbi:MAG: peroxidase [Planctomycetota bacterium]|nr:peroxidase [Planctomycetota bacterium]
MWIPTVADGQATDELQGLYERGRDRDSGKIDAILQVHALHPPGLQAHLGLYETVMRGTPGLPRVEREWIATLVSHDNGCHY